MQCPTCNREMPPGAACPHCGRAAAGVSLFTHDSTGVLTVPLTAWQRLRLLVECMPVVFFAVATVGMATVFSARVATPPVAFFAFMGVVTLVTGYQAVQRLRDLASGVARVQVDVLQRAHRSRGRGGAGRFYGHFEALGRLRLSPKAYGAAGLGGRVRLVYSPVSKIVWQMEPLR